MSKEYTLTIIKPDATERNITGQLNSYFEKSGLKIAAQKMTILTKEQAQNFYIEHKERSFFNDLVAYMTSGPVVLQVLVGEDAVVQSRKIMGATDPTKANIGTIRRDFGISIEANTVHGSDSVDSAKREVEFFFNKSEICA